MVAAPVVNGVYGPYTAPLSTTSSTVSNASVYVEANMPYAQYLVPPQQYAPSIASNPHSDTGSPTGNGSASPGKLDVRMPGHSRAVSLPASVAMQSSGSQSAEIPVQNGQYDERMYGLGLEASE